VVEPTPSPAATSSVAASTPPEPLAERLARISVRRRFPELANAHLAQPGAGHVALALMDEAIEHAEADMFVSYLASGAEAFPVAENDLIDTGAYLPYPNDPNSDVSTGVLTRYGLATYFGYSPSARDYILAVRHGLAPLPDRTPGFVWDVVTRPHATPYAIFVSVDGETYHIALKPDGPSLEPSVDPVATWPPIANPAFGRLAFVTVRRPMKSPLAPADDAFHRCAEQAWSRAKKAMTPEERDADPLPSGSVVRSACAKEIAAWERSLANSIDASVAERTALVDKAKAYVRSLALAR
jgi:hypothetical protein